MDIKQTRKIHNPKNKKKISRHKIRILLKLLKLDEMENELISSKKEIKYGK